MEVTFLLGLAVAPMALSLQLLSGLVDLDLGRLGRSATCSTYDDYEVTVRI